MASQASGQIRVVPGKTPAVVVENLVVKYKVFASGKRVAGTTSRVRNKGRLSEVTAIRGVSLVAYEGDSIGIIGGNGAGKSTLMRAIAGLVPADQGSVFARSKAAFLGVGAAMIRDLSGGKNITLGGLALGFTKQEIKEKYDEIVDFSGIGEFIDLPMATYSYGMLERLKFSIAAAKNHDILIIDEALAVGDQEFRKKSEAKMRELAAGAGIVFLVSHSMKSILDTCNRAIWIEQGEVRLDGDVREVVAAYAEFTGSPLDD
ncbi:MAG: ABC transporter ATP-binding protein [Micrococcales bacterium]